MFTILGYVAAALAGATVLTPLAKKVSSLTKTKKDDRFVAVLEKIPTHEILAFLSSRGVKTRF